MLKTNYVVYPINKLEVLGSMHEKKIVKNY